MNGLVNWIVTLLFLIGVIFIIVRMKDDEEPYYALKVLGYYLLGAFRFTINKIHIPLGFIVFLFFLRTPKKNQRGKRYAANLGLIAFAVALMIPMVVESYYERTRYIEPATTNIYELDFQGHWEEVIETLGLNEDSARSARVEDLNIDYQKDGRLKRFRYEVTWMEEGQFRHATVNFNEGQKNLEIRVTKVAQWLQYNTLISAERLFEKLHSVNIKELTPEKDFPYYGLIFRGRANFGIKDGEIFTIQGNKIVPFAGQLPVRAYWIKTFGMEQTGEHSYSSTYGSYYLFDVRYE